MAQRAQEEDPKEDDETKHVSTFRRALPQILASVAKNLMVLDLGMTIAFPTIVISALLNSNSGLSLTSTEASWFGSVGYIIQPIGSVLSGIVLGPLGRKYSMLLVNVPHVIGWFLFYSSGSVVTMFIAIIIMGFGVGFMEAPTITYIGEISEPRFRGIFTSFTGISASLGYVFVYAMGNLTDWRHVALISSAVPIITIIAISQVPETPLWLLSQGREKDAERALCWLRGWVEPRAVQKELAEMIRYSESSKLRKLQTEQLERAAYRNEVKIESEGSERKKSDEFVTPGNKNGPNQGDKKSEKLFIDNSSSGTLKHFSDPGKCQTVDSSGAGQSDEVNWKEKLKDLMRLELLKPLGFIIGYFFFINATGDTAMRPYFVSIFEKLNFPVSALHSTVVFSVIQFIANIVCSISVRWTGKRFMALVSLVICALTTTTTGIYSLFIDTDAHNGWLPFVMFFVFQFFTGYGVSPIPWMLVSEVFPFRGRSLASGVAAAASYILSFVATKTFLGLETALTVGGVFLLYGVLSFIGVLFLFYMMPETEGRSLEQIELDFKSKK